MNEFVIDAKLSSLSIGERVLATQHLEYAEKEDLILYDRGYPSFQMIYDHNKRDIDFLFRAKVDFSKFTRKFHDSNKVTEVIKFYPKSHSKFSDSIQKIHMFGFD